LGHPVGRIALAQAMPLMASLATHFSVKGYVCHICTPYLNSLADLDAIWQVLVAFSDTLCYMGDGVFDFMEGDFLGGLKPPAFSAHTYYAIC